MNNSQIAITAASNACVPGTTAEALIQQAGALLEWLNKNSEAHAKGESQAQRGRVRSVQAAVKAAVGKGTRGSSEDRGGVMHEARVRASAAALEQAIKALERARKDLRSRAAVTEALGEVDKAAEVHKTLVRVAEAHNAVYAERLEEIRNMQPPLGPDNVLTLTKP